MMTIISDNRLEPLRSRAVAKLRGSDSQEMARADASAALSVLYKLASSPSTAPDALALLHELQVHQVEVALQDEELRRSRVELEAILNRQVQLFEHAPLGYVTVDCDAVMRELNRMAAALLGVERDFLRGRSLDGFLIPESVSALHAMFNRLVSGAPPESAELRVRGQSGGQGRCIHATICLDPAGEGFLIGLTGVDLVRGLM